MEIVTQSPQETQEFGKKFASRLKRRLPAGRQGEILALTGELGSGKTTFVQGLAQGLGIKERIISPTFILMREHQGSRKVLYHIDLYRLEENVEGEFRSLGVEDFWRRNGNIVAVEWAEKVKGLLPKDTVWVRFETVKENERRITIGKK